MKAAIITDQHFGARKNSKLFQKTLRFFFQKNQENMKTSENF